MYNPIQNGEARDVSLDSFFVFQDSHILLQWKIFKWTEFISFLYTVDDFQLVRSPTFVSGVLCGKECRTDHLNLFHCRFLSQNYLLTRPFEIRSL